MTTNSPTNTSTPALSWGTAKTHNLQPGDELWYGGKDRKNPAPPVRGTYRVDGSSRWVALDHGKVASLGGVATRFHATTVEMAEQEATDLAHITNRYPTAAEMPEEPKPIDLSAGIAALRKASKAVDTYAGTDEGRIATLVTERNSAMVALREAGSSYSQMAEAMGVVPMTARGRYLKVASQ